MIDGEGNLLASNMEKLQSPYRREPREINGKNHYVVKEDIDLDYMWVFEDPEVYAMEKLDGTNVSIMVENGVVKEVWNRKNLVSKLTKVSGDVYNDVYDHTEGFNHVLEGMEDSWEETDGLSDGQHFGELIGLGIQKNPMDIPNKRWVPFNTFGKKHLVYDEWKDVPKNFSAISEFMKNLKSKYYALNHDGKEEYAEGIIFYRPSTGEMAKLRRDMYDWWIIEHPDVLNPHVNTYSKKPKRKPPTGMQGEFAVLSKKFKQNLISKEEYEVERNSILEKYNIK